MKNAKFTFYVANNGRSKSNSKDEQSIFMNILWSKSNVNLQHSNSSQLSGNIYRLQNELLRKYKFKHFVNCALLHTLEEKNTPYGSGWLA